MIKILFIIAYLILCASDCFAAFTQVQTATQYAGGATTSGSATLSATGLNNLVVVSIKVGSASDIISSVTDDKSNTYTKVAGVSNASGTFYLAQYYSIQSTAAATSVTVNLSSSSSLRFGVDEYSGNATTSVLNGYATGNNLGGSTSLSTSTLTTPSGNLIVASGALSAAQTWTAGSGYTLYSGSGSVTVRSEYKLSSSTSETAPATIGVSAYWSEIASSFNPSNSAGVIQNGGTVQYGGTINF